MGNSQNNSSDENWRDAMGSAMTYDRGCLNMSNR
jgi:hypothetical protein